MAFLVLPRAIATLGDEFQVNTFTTGAQQAPAVAVDVDGDFVVVWTSDGQDGSGYGIFAQRYAADGTPQAGEFQVNTSTAGWQWEPAVAMDAAGDFVVVWATGTYGSDDIFAQRYDASGIPQGGEFQVNTTGGAWQDLPAVAMDSAGDFVVAWRNVFQDGSQSGIFAQRYAADGTPQGGEFQVNTYTLDDQLLPAVAMDADGDFVVVWASWHQDGSETGIFAQRYDASGTPQGGEFQVNTFTTDLQDYPAVAMDADGNFVVAWYSYQYGASDGIFAQRYGASGAPQGSEFQVNTYTASAQQEPAVALDTDGDFVVVWQSWCQDECLGFGIFAQRFDASGTPQESEFQVNTYTADSQLLPAVALDAAGDFVVVWQSEGQDGDSSGIFGRGFSIPNSSFTGKVKNAARQPVAGATIGAYQSAVLKFSTTSAADGRYTLDVAAGTYDLVASKPADGYLDTTKPGMSIADNQTLTKIKFKLFRPSFFQGTVSEKGTGTAIDGALVEAVKSGVTVASTLTAADGTYSLQVIKGTYTLRASKAGYKTKQKLDQKIGDGATKTVNIALPLLP